MQIATFLRHEPQFKLWFNFEIFDSFWLAIKDEQISLTNWSTIRENYWYFTVSNWNVNASQTVNFCFLRVQKPGNDS